MTVIEFKKEKELQVCDNDNKKKTIENNPFLADIDKQGNIAVCKNAKECKK